MTSSQPSKTCVPVTLLTLLLIGQISTQDATVTYQVREELRPDTYIGSVALDSELFTDISNEKFKLLHFQILKEGNKDVDYFKIEKETSFLWTRSVIDREKFTECFETCLIEFNVAVFDLEEADFTFVIKVEITLQDYNDNAPEFINIENPVLISELKSVGSIIVSGAAVDLDKGKDNSVKSYSFLQSSDVFDLRTVQTGQNTPEFELYLKAELDRETVTSYSLVILAKDGGEPQQTGTLTLEILVIDDNDNIPVFDTPEYSTSVEENFALNRTVLQLHASDIDSGENGHISYKFSNTVADKILNIFNIKETTGELVTVGYIDFEKDKEFSFVVVVFDHGNPPKSSSASIYINVIDVNDNSPIINLNQPPGGTVISELAEIGSFITHLEIIDLDSDENGQIECNISDNHFGIESVPGIENNYKIVLSTMLDHDTMANHNVTIFCHDLGDPPRQTYANFIVHVEDVNDNIPVFTENVYAVTVDENNRLDASVLTVSAIDHDSGNYGQVSYSLHADSDGLFKIDSFTGVIRANVSLDRETHGDQVIFRVLAIDKSDEPQTSTGTCVVNINDLNDNAPTIDSDSLKLYVYENQQSGAQVGNITARDPDNGVNGTFVYQFPDDPDVLEYFSFNETGLITTNKILDREVLPVHTFMVEAIDLGGKTGSARIRIYVRDLNDNSPEIIYPNEYDDTISIPSSFPVSSEVLRIEARDYDTGDNARLYYFIDSDNASYAFVLNVITGSVFLNRSLHEKDIGQIFQFHMRVKDGGIPALTATTKLNIHITEAVMGYLSEDRSSQRNLWIVVAIVIVTTVLSAIILIIIIKMCWCGQGKNENGSTAEIISESNDLDPRYSDSFSAISSSSKDSNSNMKSKDEVYQIKDGYQGGYYSNMDEKDYSKSSLDCHSAYIEQLKVVSSLLLHHVQYHQLNHIMTCVYNSCFLTNNTLDSPAYLAFAIPVFGLRQKSRVLCQCMIIHRAMGLCI